MSTPRATRPRARRASLYLIVGAVTVLVVALVVLMATGRFLPRPESTSTLGGKLLESAGNSYEVPIGQYAAIDFFLNSPSTIHGSFATTDGAATFVFNITSYDKFQRSAGLDTSGAVWSIGNVSQGSYDFQLSQGSWVLVWTTTSQIWGTQVTLVTDLTADPG